MEFLLKPEHRTSIQARNQSVCQHLDWDNIDQPRKESTLPELDMDYSRLLHIESGLAILQVYNDLVLQLLELVNVIQ